jgi:uroporphyrinogen decarboxylase
MLPIERVLNTFQGKSVDQVPFALVTSMYGARLSSCPLNDYYSDPEKYLSGQVAVADIIGQDILFTPFALVIEAEAFGAEAVSFQKNPPNLKTPAITSYKDISKLKLPDVDNQPGLAYILESTRLMAKKFKDKVAVAAICNSPADLPALIMGLETWIDTLLFHPEEAKRMMELTSQFFISFANKLLSEGATCIFIPASSSNPTIITYKIAKELLVPSLRKSFAQIRGPIVFHHGGARLLPFLDLLHNLPNVAGFVVHPHDSFDEVRSITGKVPVVMGNINGQLLWKASLKTIENWCLKILENRKDDHKFILTSSSADIPYDTPVENLQIIGRTVQKYCQS